MLLPGAAQGLSSFWDWGEDPGLPSSWSQCPAPRFCGRLGRSPSRVPCSACTPSPPQGAGPRTMSLSNLQPRLPASSHCGNTRGGCGGKGEKGEGRPAGPLGSRGVAGGCSPSARAIGGAGGQRGGRLAASIRLGPAPPPLYCGSDTCQMRAMG